MSNNYHLWLKFLLAKLPTFHSPKTKDNFFTFSLTLLNISIYFTQFTQPSPKILALQFFSIRRETSFFNSNAPTMSGQALARAQHLILLTT